MRNSAERMVTMSNKKTTATTRKEENGMKKTVEEVRNSNEYKYHHTGSRRGYESRKGNGHVEKYDGRFGKGYMVISPRRDTTQYVNVEYYITK